MAGWMRRWEKGKKECQEIVTLNPAQIDEQLFTDLEKFPGILSATPLIELDVQLKVDDCIIDTKLTGIDLNRLPSVYLNSLRKRRRIRRSGIR